MTDRTVVGVQPWLPWPLSRWSVWTEPIRAERLAAFRIAVAAVLVVDILVTYLPWAEAFFGKGGLGSPEVFAGRSEAPHWHWSFLRGVEDPRWWPWLLLLWTAAAVLLLVGWRSRLIAIVTWVMAISIFNLNYYLHNGGDRVRNIELFYLVLAPCGAAWSLDQRRQGEPGPVFISPWPLRLLFVQLVVIYYFNGVYKLGSPDWRTGVALHHALGNVQWSRWPGLIVWLPDWSLKAITWFTLTWELGFPIFAYFRPTRKLTFWIGVLFHLGSGLLLRLGMFPLYMLCLYVPLLPWERWNSRRPEGGR